MGAERAGKTRAGKVRADWVSEGGEEIGAMNTRNKTTPYADAASGSLSPVLRGEGWGEGPGVGLRNSPERLTLTLSSEYRGEGTRRRLFRASRISMRL